MNRFHIWFKDKEISRKEFLKITALAGLGISLPFPLARKTYAAPPPNAPNPQPFWVLIHAGGGWDPTSICDPKGGLVNHFAGGVLVNGFNLAPPPGSWIGTSVGLDHILFQSYPNYIRVINGIDTTTNNHDTGPIYIWSGKISQGHPTFGALIAAVYGASRPLAFINNGGYSYTAGIMGTTQVSNLNQIRALAQPNIISGTDRYFTDETLNRINQFRLQRVQRLINEQKLPGIKEALKALEQAQINASQLDQFIAHVDYLNNRLTVGHPDYDANFAAAYNNQGNLYGGLARQFAIAFAAYNAGLCASANLSIGGFDTHDNHDNTQMPAINRIMRSVKFMLDEAQLAYGNLNKIMIAIGSDFGRTNRYNGANGKDHWPITSMIFAGGLLATRSGITGGTDSDHKPNVAMSPVPGRIIKPSHVHWSLRRLAGIENAVIPALGLTVKQAFPTVPDNEGMNMFGDV